MSEILIRKQSGNFKKFDHLRIWCMNSFLKRLKGLMFTNEIRIDQAALFINSKESIVDSAIHMLFMNYDIAVFWLNNSNVIVDKKIAKKWNLIYYPIVKASKILETNIKIYDELHIGEKIIIESK